MGERAFLETPTVLKTGAELRILCNKLLDLDTKEKVDAEEEGKTVVHKTHSLQPVSKTAGETKNTNLEEFSDALKGENQDD